MDVRVKVILKNEGFYSNVNFPIGNSVRVVPLGVYLHELNFSECDAIFMTTHFRGQG